MKPTRREFLRQSSCGLTAAALIAGMERFARIDALAQANDYKALVCIFLFGGNDSNNMIIPYDDYVTYAAVRSSGATVQIPLSSLLPISPPGAGGRFGFHPSLAGLHELWTMQKLAVLCNTGPLVEPTNRAGYTNGTAKRPQNLFSHSDQQAQWQTSVSTGQSQTGWGGRASDKAGVLNPAGANFPMFVSLSGLPIFSTGLTTRPLVLAAGAPFKLEGFPDPPDSDPRYAALVQLLAVDDGNALVESANRVTSQAVQNSAALAALPPINTPFPANNQLGAQLKEVAQIIKLNQATLGLRRQFFFCSLGGFDLHNAQVTVANPTTGTHANLLDQLSAAMRAFYAATEEIGAAAQVTTFTLSDFGRTFAPNNGAGTDHAWGSHHFIMGGSVRGGNFFGAFPTLAPNGPDDTDTGGSARGRWIPTTSVDQYGAALAAWYGVSAVDLAAVFPNLNRFGALPGFLG
jgi:uncharacterized protein (DUF1501 family)